MNDIPVIDFSGANVEASEREAQVSRQIDRACREVGFFTVCGHGIGASIINNAHASLKKFFSRSLSEKVLCKLGTGFTMEEDRYTPYGYSGLLEENAYAYMGQPGRPSDYVEKFSVGRLILDDEAELPFNDDEQGRELRRNLKHYYLACETLAARIAELITISLDLPRDFFVTRTNNSNDSMRCHMYPGFSEELANDQGMGMHADSSLISLLTHTAPGIQVQTLNGEWITPQFRTPDEFIVNIGDLLAHWTGNQYVSTPHQVVLSGQARQSIVFFKLTNEDEVVAIGNKQMDALFGRAS